MNSQVKTDIDTTNTASELTVNQDSTNFDEFVKGLPNTSANKIRDIQSTLKESEKNLAQYSNLAIDLKSQLSSNDEQNLLKINPFIENLGFLSKEVSNLKQAVTNLQSSDAVDFEIEYILEIESMLKSEIETLSLPDIKIPEQVQKEEEVQVQKEEEVQVQMQEEVQELQVQKEMQVLEEVQVQEEVQEQAKVPEQELELEKEEKEIQEDSKNQEQVKEEVQEEVQKEVQEEVPKEVQEEVQKEVQEEVQVQQQELKLEDKQKEIQEEELQLLVEEDVKEILKENNQDLSNYTFETHPKTGSDNHHFKGCDEIKVIDGKSYTPLSSIFDYTPEKLLSHFYDKDYISASAQIVESNKLYFFNIQIAIHSKLARDTYGGIEKGSALRIELINGDKIILYNLNRDFGTYNEQSEKMIYKLIYSIKKDDLKLLSKRDLDKIGIIWTTGYEDYEIYETDFLINHINCFNIN